MLPDWAYSEFTLSILGMKEADGTWCALGLEMDLRGYGDTFEKALKDLRDSIAMQIGFAIYKNQPELIAFPADPSFFTLYAQSRAEKLRHVTSEESDEADYRTGGLSIPAAHVIAKTGSDFAPTSDG